MRDKPQKTTPARRDDPAAYRVSEFCSAFGICPATLYKAIRDGYGPATFKVGRRRLISREAAEEWRRRLESTTEAA